MLRIRWPVSLAIHACARNIETCPHYPYWFGRRHVAMYVVERTGRDPVLVRVLLSLIGNQPSKPYWLVLSPLWMKLIVACTGQDMNDAGRQVGMPAVGALQWSDSTVVSHPHSPLGASAIVFIQACCFQNAFLKNIFTLFGSRNTIIFTKDWILKRPNKTGKYWRRSYTSSPRFWFPGKNGRRRFHARKALWLRETQR